MPAISNINLVVVLGLSTIATIVAVCLPYAAITTNQGLTSERTTTYTLWKVTTESAAGGTSTAGPSDVCGPMGTRMLAGQGLALSTIIVGIVAALVNMLRHSALLAHDTADRLVVVKAIARHLFPLPLAMGLVVLAAALSVATMAVAVNLFAGVFGGACGDTSIADADGSDKTKFGIPIFATASIGHLAAFAAFWFADNSTVKAHAAQLAADVDADTHDGVASMAQYAEKLNA